MNSRSTRTAPFPTKLVTDACNLAQIYQQAPIGLSIFDRDLCHVLVNGHMAIINGKSADQHTGKTLQQINPRVALALEPIIRVVLAEGRTITEMETEVSTTTTVDAPEASCFLTSAYPLKIGRAHV